jgi:hypothetical protein
MDGPKPLAGITVLDMSQGIAGPSCASHFAAYGARVIKLEPPGGDWIRQLGARIAGSSAATIAYNRGKESIAVDLKTKEGREIALKLGEKAQVVLESARPGVMERLGLGFAAFRERNPGVVYVSISGYGQRGPKREAAMVDTVGQPGRGTGQDRRASDRCHHRALCFPGRQHGVVGAQAGPARPASRHLADAIGGARAGSEHRRACVSRAPAQADQPACR